MAGHFRSEHLVVTLDTSAWGGSALTDPSIDVPVAGGDDGIPVTYVPARNSIFLAVALGVAEARGLDAVWIGVNAIDYSGYPDCRPEFIEAFRGVAATGQKRGVEGRPIGIRTPLIESTKAEIIRTGLAARRAPGHDVVVLPGRRRALRHLRRLRPTSARVRRGGHRRSRTAMMTTEPPTDILATEVFSAIQGEAALVGERQVFVRLTGCNIRCAYCDQPEALDLRPGPCRIERTPGRRDWQVVDSPLPILLLADAVDRLLAPAPPLGEPHRWRAAHADPPGDRAGPAAGRGRTTGDARDQRDPGPGAASACSRGSPT